MSIIFVNRQTQLACLETMLDLWMDPDQDPFDFAEGFIEMMSFDEAVEAIAKQLEADFRSDLHLEDGTFISALAMVGFRKIHWPQIASTLLQRFKPQEAKDSPNLDDDDAAEVG